MPIGTIKLKDRSNHPRKGNLTARSKGRVSITQRLPFHQHKGPERQSTADTKLLGQYSITLNIIEV